MISHEKHEPIRTLVVITTPKLADKASDMFKEFKIPIQYEWHGVGTAPSEIIDILGLGNPNKTVLISFTKKHCAEELLKKLKKKLKFGTVNSGIAFTIPITSANSLIVKMLEQSDESKFKNLPRKDDKRMSDSKYSVIAVIVNQGYSENVMEAAREAGAHGGTVIPSRRIGNEQTIGFWGMGIQNENDTVLIVAENSHKLEIMQVIGEKCGIHSEAKGIVLSMPIDTVIGIEDEDDDE